MFRRLLPAPLTVFSLLIRPVDLQVVAPRSDCWDPPAAEGSPGDRTSVALAPRVITAARIKGGPAPAIDGKLDEPAWCRATPVSDFIQSTPNPGAIATLPSVARVVYDESAIYVGLRLTDPAVDSLVAPYPRRDDEVTSDWVFVELDSRFDHRSGFSFGVNPRGVQADGSWANDVDYDPAWNGVWEAAAHIDSAGWTVEFRIPYSQLALGKSAPGSPLVWGINFYRYSPHRGESSNWSPRLRTQVGVVSHFNQLRGLIVPPPHVPLEITPYSAVTATRTPGSVPGNEVTPGAGLDLKLRPTPATTLALSLHPDFGQVEADPSQVNLTSFETFFPEQRPLFVEGTDVFQFDATLDFATRGTSFSAETPFYSRRIGRPPRGQCPTGSTRCERPVASTLLGALRISGRTPAGWSGGLFHAWTASEDARFVDGTGRERTAQVEPLTHFTVGRVVREFGSGRAALGGMATLVGRVNREDGLDTLLSRNALVVGGDARWRFADDSREITAFALVSHRDAVTSVNGGEAGTGATLQTRLAKVTGRFLWGIAGRMVTPEFESNDVGFQRNADWILAVADWRYEKYRPGRGLRRWSIGSRQLGVGWTFAGDRRALVANLTGTFDLRNYWGGSVALDHEFTSDDPEFLRGGPVFRRPAQDLATVKLYSDTRRRWQMTLTAQGAREMESGSQSLDLSTDLTAFMTDRLQVGLSPMAGWNRAGWQYVGQASDSTGQSHFVLGRLHQVTAALTVRATYAFSAYLTLQLYTQLFASGGTYDEFKEVVDPVAQRSSDRVAPITPSRLSYDSAAARYTVDTARPTGYGFANPDFSERDLHLNLLLRWEFLPGSTLFLVWTHRRNNSEVDAFGLGREWNQIWKAPGENAFIAKVSYWLHT